MTWPLRAAINPSQRRRGALEFFSRPLGVNTTLPETQLGPNELATALNWKLNEYGQLETREGITQVTSSATPGASSLKYVRYIPIGASTYVFGVDASYRAYKYTGALTSLAPGTPLPVMTAIADDDCSADNTADWTTDASATLAFDTDHYEITVNGASQQDTYLTSLTFENGEKYKLSIDIKDGTASSKGVKVANYNGTTLQSSTDYTTTVTSTTVNHYFTADGNTDGVGIRVNADLSGNDIEIKNVTCYKVSLEGVATLIPFNGYCVILDGGYIKYTQGTQINLAYDYGSGSDAYTYDNTCATLATAAEVDLYSGATTRCGAQEDTQSWTTGYTIPLKQFEFWLSKTGSPTGTVTGKLYDSSGANLLDTATTNVNAANLTTNASKKTFTFDGSYGLAPSTTYIFAVEYSGGDASNYVTVHGSNPGSGGNQYYYNGTWNAAASYNVACGVKPGRPPKASFGDVKSARLFLSGDPDNPGYVWFTNVNTLFDYSTTDGGGYVSAVDDNADSFPVGGIIAHYGDLYVIGKAQQPYACRLAGSSPSNYALPPLFQEIHTTDKTLLSIANDIWFAATESVYNVKGVQEYGDIRTFTAGDPVAFTIKSNWDTDAFAGYNPQDGQYWLKLTGVSDILICHTRHGYQGRTGITRYPWTEYQLASQTPSCFATFAGDFYIGCTDGHLYVLDNSVVQDASSNPTFTLTGGFLESPYGTLNTDELYLNMTSTAAITAATLTFYVNGSGTKLFDKSVGKMDAPTQYDVNFNWDSVQLKLHTLSITAPVKIQRISMNHRRLSFRGQ